MQKNPVPQAGQDGIVPPLAAEIPFATLLYRFLFFDWLFADMSKAKDLFERHAAWQHNRAMRRHLPLYLQRWSVLAIVDFGLGCIFEHGLDTVLVAAWFYTWSCVTLTGMALTSVLWAFLYNPEMP